MNIKYILLYYAGAVVEVNVDNDKNFKGLFFQDPQMISCFQAYPELLCVDATYKLLNLGLPTYLFHSEDSNGQSEIVAVSLLVSEDAEGITWMFKAFKKFNVAWESTRVIMADKDIQERDVFKCCMPQAMILICLFHTLRSFRREITCEKMGITSGQRNLCLELIQKMAYSMSETDYNSIYEQFVSSVPKLILEYFNKNWHDIRHEWVHGLKFSCGNFLNSTNNRLESINGKLKQVIDRNSSLEDFLFHFFCILTALRTERDHKAAVMFQKVRVCPFPKDSAEYSYSQLLTSYAFTFVNKQLKLIDKVKNFEEVEEGYVCQTSEGSRNVNLSDCSCTFRT